MPLLHLITNPFGGLGRGRQLAAQVQSLLEPQQWKVATLETDAPGAARRLAAELVLGPGDAVGAIGGDGTLHEVVNGLADRTDNARPPVAAFAGGTSNSFVHTLGPGDVPSIVAGIVAGRVRSVDLATVRFDSTVMLSLSILHCGMTVAAARWSERLRWLGPARYQLGALAALLLSAQREYQLTLDDKPVASPATVLLQLTRGPARSEGKRWCLAPRLELDDGRLDVITLAPMSRRDRMRVFGKSRDGSYVDEPGVDYHKVKKLVLQAAPGEVVNIDGEFRTLQSGRVEVRAEPGALCVFDPNVTTANHEQQEQGSPI